MATKGGHYLDQHEIGNNNIWHRWEQATNSANNDASLMWVNANQTIACIFLEVQYLLIISLLGHLTDFRT